MLHPPPIQCQKITRSAISRKLINQNQKKNVILDNIFLHASANFEVKIQNNHCYRSRLTFQHLEKHHLRVRYSKIQNRLSRAP